MNERETAPARREISENAAAQSAMPDNSSGMQGFLLPTETEIYLLPNGQVVVADLPAELTDLVEKLGSASPPA